MASNLSTDVRLSQSDQADHLKFTPQTLGQSSYETVSFGLDLMQPPSPKLSEGVYFLRPKIKQELAQLSDELVKFMNQPFGEEYDYTYDEEEEDY